MALQSDSQGFLVGDPIDLGRMPGYLRDIKDDVAAIRKAVAGTSPNSTRQAAKPTLVPTANRQQVATPSRGANGQFLPSVVNNKTAEPPKTKSASADIVTLAARLNHAARGGLAGTAEIDPLAKSFQEVAEPMRRGLEFFRGGPGDKQTSWLRKIFGKLNVFHKDSSTFEKAAKNSLKNIDDKSVVGGGRERSSGIGSVLSSVGSMLLTGITSVLGVVFSPIGLAIGVAATAAWGLFTESGQKFFADIGGKISENFSAAIESFKSTFPGITDSFEKAAESIANIFNPIIEFFKNKFGIVSNFAKETVNNVTDKAKKTGAYLAESSPKTMAAINTAKDVGSKAWEGAKSIGGKIGDRWGDAKSFLSSAAEKAGIDPGIIAKIANFESGFNADAAPIKKDGTRISSAHGYGQFLDGTWTDMINKHGSKYGIEGAGKLTKEQAAKYRNDKTIQAGMLAEFTKANVEKGRKYGGENDDANVYAFHNLGDKDAKNLLGGMKQNPNMSVRDALLQGSTSEKERARVEKVISGNKSLYGDGNIAASEAYNKMGSVMRRGDVFAADINSRVAAAPITISAPPVPTVKMPSAGPVADSPQVVQPLGGGNSDRPTTVNLPSQDVGRDLSDRGIAHIVTGGLSS